MTQKKVKKLINLKHREGRGHSKNRADKDNVWHARSNDILAENGIWMPDRGAKHRNEQKDTHGVLQTASLGGAVHTKATPALPPCMAHQLA